MAAAKVSAQRTKIEAEAQAEATSMHMAAEAEAPEAQEVRIKAHADAQVIDRSAREMEMRWLEVARIGAYRSKTVFVPSEGAILASQLLPYVRPTKLFLSSCSFGYLIQPFLPPSTKAIF